MNKEDRESYLKYGICPTCKKNSVFGNEKNCPECRARNSNAKYIYVQKNRDKVNAQQRATRKSRYDADIENGICPRCRKNKCEDGKKRCAYCRIKDNEARRRRRLQMVSIPRNARAENGICYFCNDSIIPGYKVCQKHYDLNVKNQKKSNRKLMKIQYGKKECANNA